MNKLPPRIDEVPKQLKKLKKRANYAGQERSLPPPSDDDVKLYDEPSPPKRLQRLKAVRQLSDDDIDVMLYDEPSPPKRLQRLKARKPKRSTSDDTDEIHPKIKSPRKPKQGSDMVSLILSQGKYVGKGNEAQVYKYKGDAYKVFTNLTTYMERIQRNVKFLQENKESGVVPRYIDSNIKGGWIHMEYLKGYAPLTAGFVNDCGNQERGVCKEQKKWKLLKAICRARDKLSDTVHFTDLAKWENMAYKMTDKGNFSIKFYEGGESEKVAAGGARRDFCLEIARKMNMIRIAKERGMF